MIEFLARLPTDMMIFITMAVLGLAGNADSAEMADLGRLLINAQIAAGYAQAGSKGNWGSLKGTR
jgi:hypothetical protein